MTRLASSQRGRLLGMYEQMAVIRRTEKAAYDLFLAGLVKGTTHLASGQEAVAVGASAALQPRGLCLRDLPRSPPRDGQRRDPGGVPGRADAEGNRAVQGQGRLDAPDLRGRQHARLLRDRRRPPADGGRRRVVGSAARHRSGGAWPSSATAPPTSARSTRRSTWPRSGSCRSSSCARTTSTWSTRRSERSPPPTIPPPTGLRPTGCRHRSSTATTSWSSATRSPPPRRALGRGTARQ